MFQELMPLLAERFLVLTLSRVNGEEICLNVISDRRQAIQASAVSPTPGNRSSSRLQGCAPCGG